MTLGLASGDIGWRERDGSGRVRAIGRALIGGRCVLIVGEGEAPGQRRQQAAEVQALERCD